MWLLQSPNQRFGVWIYYPKLDSDTYFKVLSKYVVPRINLEEENKQTLIENLSVEENTGKKRALNTKLENLEGLLSDLHSFRES